ncbi:hypothetical protein PMSD_19035 [Paenibacillus macquariensis subsp. defensor]|nr:hypothetical protein PMSD_19035 [Paenibacillus macquariensis subsp. defensor]
MTTVLEDIFMADINWLDALPPYQSKSIQQLMDQGKSYEEISILWLSANGPANTYPFGANNTKSLFFEKLMEEVEHFICREDKYTDEKKKLLTQFKAGDVYVVTFISAIIAPVVGATSVLIAPAIALILMTVLRMGINAWCAVRIDLKQQNTDQT